MKYNPKILQKEVDRLYRLSNAIIFIFTFVFFIFGLIIGYLILLLSKNHVNSDSIEYILGITFGLIGLAAGLERSFKLRLEAQKLLCMLSIKQDTELLLLSRFEENQYDEELESEKQFSIGGNNYIIDNETKNKKILDNVHFHFNRRDDL